MLNGIDPEAYLRYVLASIADLLPWNVADQLNPQQQPLAA
jgi:hypothetical protein